MKLTELERAVVEGERDASRELPGYRLVRIIMGLRERVEALESECEPPPRIAHLPPTPQGSRVPADTREAA